MMKRVWTTDLVGLCIISVRLAYSGRINDHGWWAYRTTFFWFLDFKLLNQFQQSFSGPFCVFWPCALVSDSHLKPSDWACFGHMDLRSKQKGIQTHLILTIWVRIQKEQPVSSCRHSTHIHQFTNKTRAHLGSAFPNLWPWSLVVVP